MALSIEFSIRGSSHMCHGPAWITMFNVYLGFYNENWKDLGTHTETNKKKNLSLNQSFNQRR